MLRRGANSLSEKGLVDLGFAVGAEGRAEVNDVVDALVLTHRRRTLATRTVDRLLSLDVGRVVVVVNGDGGVDMGDLAHAADRVELLVLPENVGPAGGYAAGFAHLEESSDAQWWLVCEDDLAAIDPPDRDLAGLVRRVRLYERAHDVSVGAVTAYGRQLSPATGIARLESPLRVSLGLLPGGVAAWGSTLVSRDVFAAGVEPDGHFFFGYEDFDWFLRVRAGGFEVLLDHEYMRRLGGRSSRLDPTGRPKHDDLSAWRIYYSTREFFRFARRHGDVRWLVVHVVRSVRRAQLSADGEAWRALAAGVRDGARGRTGRVDRWHR